MSQQGKITRYDKYRDYLQHIELYDGISTWFDILLEDQLDWTPTNDQLLYAQELLARYEPVESLDRAD